MVISSVAARENSTIPGCVKSKPFGCFALLTPPALRADIIFAGDGAGWSLGRLWIRIGVTVTVPPFLV